MKPIFYCLVLAVTAKNDQLAGTDEELDFQTFAQRQFNPYDDVQKIRQKFWSGHSLAIAEEKIRQRNAQNNLKFAMAKSQVEAEAMGLDENSRLQQITDRVQSTNEWITTVWPTYNEEVPTQNETRVEEIVNVNKEAGVKEEVQRKEVLVVASNNTAKTEEKKVVSRMCQDACNLARVADPVHGAINLLSCQENVARVELSSTSSNTCDNTFVSRVSISTNTCDNLSNTLLSNIQSIHNDHSCFTRTPSLSLEQCANHLDQLPIATVVLDTLRDDCNLNQNLGLTSDDPDVFHERFTSFLSRCLPSATVSTSKGDIKTEKIRIQIQDNNSTVGGTSFTYSGATTLQFQCLSSDCSDGLDFAIHNILGQSFDYSKLGLDHVDFRVVCSSNRKVRSTYPKNVVIPQNVRDEIERVPVEQKHQDRASSFSDRFQLYIQHKIDDLKGAVQNFGYDLKQEIIDLLPEEFQEEQRSLSMRKTIQNHSTNTTPAISLKRKITTAEAKPSVTPTITLLYDFSWTVRGRMEEKEKSAHQEQQHSILTPLRQEVHQIAPATTLVSGPILMKGAAISALGLGAATVHHLHHKLSHGHSHHKVKAQPAKSKKNPAVNKKGENMKSILESVEESIGNFRSKSRKYKAAPGNDQVLDRPMSPIKLNRTRSIEPETLEDALTSKSESEMQTIKNIKPIIRAKSSDFVPLKDSSPRITLMPDHGFDDEIMMNTQKKKKSNNYTFSPPARKVNKRKLRAKDRESGVIHQITEEEVKKQIAGGSPAAGIIRTSEKSISSSSPTQNLQQIPKTKSVDPWGRTPESPQPTSNKKTKVIGATINGNSQEVHGGRKSRYTHVGIINDSPAPKQLDSIQKFDEFGKILRNFL